MYFQWATLDCNNYAVVSQVGYWKTFWWNTSLSGKTVRAIAQMQWFASCNYKGNCFAFVSNFSWQKPQIQLSDHTEAQINCTIKMFNAWQISFLMDLWQPRYNHKRGFNVLFNYTSAYYRHCRTYKPVAQSAPKGEAHAYWGHHWTACSQQKHALVHLLNCWANIWPH